MGREGGGTAAGTPPPTHRRKREGSRMTKNLVQSGGTAIPGEAREQSENIIRDVGFRPPHIGNLSSSWVQKEKKEKKERRSELHVISQNIPLPPKSGRRFFNRTIKTRGGILRNGGLQLNGRIMIAALCEVYGWGDIPAAAAPKAFVCEFATRHCCKVARDEEKERGVLHRTRRA